ncbi:hypothetical protein ACFQ15_05810 [Sphingomonas hankookensis]|uniref:hypothetical protein n=1 Tax=Sphingomonas hankookensis TaxID=563996 RepID=UPI001F5AF1B3|nr:hypothetical protein [Sphingomonas hankookensis]
MSQRHSLIAFGALLFAICYLATIAAWLARDGKYAEALGFGGLTTGLVGVLGTFRPKNGVEPAGTKTDPIATEEVR